jgi:hypothetical protein
MARSVFPTTLTASGMPATTSTTFAEENVEGATRYASA